MNERNANVSISRMLMCQSDQEEFPLLDGVMACTNTNVFQNTIASVPAEVCGLVIIYVALNLNIT